MLATNPIRFRILVYTTVCLVGLVLACGGTATRIASVATPVVATPTPTTTPTLEPSPTLTPTSRPASGPGPTPLHPRVPVSGEPVPIEDLIYRSQSPFVFGPKEMQPGQSYQFFIGLAECCVVITPVEAQAKWSVTPTTGATIDPETGVFSVDDATRPDAEFTVLAETALGGYRLTKDILVYTAEANPLVGNWVEEETGQIVELLFHADGEFSLTWVPLEIYVDYWGTYTYDLEDGSIEFTITGSRIPRPSQFNGSGFYSIDGAGRLILTDICLGDYVDDRTAPTINCGHRFVHR